MSSSRSSLFGRAIRTGLMILQSATSLLHAGNGTNKFALLVGINDYGSPANCIGGWDENQSRRTCVPPLRGAINDLNQVRTTLLRQYGFEPGSIVVLANQAATRETILTKLRGIFVDRAHAGDTGVFFFAGHGSQVRNLLSAETDKYDETIVPADSLKGAPDIRDKELAEIFRAAALKGVVLTVISDSCHSGSIARGTPGTVRLVPEGRAISEAPKLDPATGKPFPDPYQLGVLVLSAGGEQQAAAESMLDGEWHGNFTWVLCTTLNSAPKERFRLVFRSVEDRMAILRQNQRPEKEGVGRDDLDLLGGPPVSLTERLFSVDHREGKTVYLRGGWADGLQKGYDLKNAVGASRAPQRLFISADTEPNRAIATVVAGDEKSIVPGDRFQVEHWVPAKDRALALYLPPAPPSASMIESAARELARLRDVHGITWVADPLDGFSDSIDWNGSQWELVHSATPQAIGLGVHPTAAAVEAALGSRETTLYLDLPAPKEITQGIRDGIQGNGSEIALTVLGSANYRLRGRWQDNHSEYSWVIPDANLTTEASSAIPRRTDWHFGSNDVVRNQLNFAAASLARLKFLYTVQSGSGIDPDFPFHLEIAAHGDAAMGNFASVVPVTLRQGGSYSIVLRASAPEAEKAQARYVYLLSIDNRGCGSLLTRGEHPYPEQGGDPQPEIELVPSGELTIGKPFGIDTLVLIYSATPLSDQGNGLAPSAVRNDGATCDEQNSRGSSAGDIRQTWGIQRLRIQTVPAEGSRY